MIAKDKLTQWRQFSAIVEKHIKNYVVPQYGDFPDKTIKKYNNIKIQAKLEAYVDRIGKSSRGRADGVRDAVKIAHFAMYLFSFLTTNDSQSDLSDIKDFENA
jgi:hypothetical protein